MCCRSMYASLISTPFCIERSSGLGRRVLSAGPSTYLTNTTSALGRTRSGHISAPPVWGDSHHQELRAAVRRAFCHVPAPRGARDVPPPVSGSKLPPDGKQNIPVPRPVLLSAPRTMISHARLIRINLAPLPCTWRALMWLHWYERPSRQWLCRLHGR